MRDTTTLLQVMGLGMLDWSCSLNIFLLKFIWIPGYSDKGGLCVVYAHPGTIRGWSEYLWIPGYSDKGVYAHSGTIPGWSEYLWIPGWSEYLWIPGWSEYLWIPGYSDKGVVCGVYSSRYNPEYLWILG